jgi:hypothetical protein
MRSWKRATSGGTRRRNTAGTPRGTPASRRIRQVAVLFMLGSGCFAAAAFPGISVLAPAELLALTFFVGSLLFTSAAYLQFQLSASAPGLLGPGFFWQHGRIDRIAGTVQLTGTVWFNVNTFAALFADRTAQQNDLRVWTPDMIGSICFLAASGLALSEVRYLRRARDGDVRRSWSIAVVNEIGSVLFMLAAIAAFVRPNSSEPLGAYLANGGTFLGALCFFWGARLLLPVASPAGLGSDLTRSNS